MHVYLAPILTQPSQLGFGIARAVGPYATYGGMSKWMRGLKLLVSEIDPAKMHNGTTLMVDLHSMFLCLLRRFSRNKKERLC